MRKKKTFLFEDFVYFLYILEMNEMGPNSSKSGEFFEIACPMAELQIWLRFLKRRPARSLSDLETVERIAFSCAIDGARR